MGQVSDEARELFFLLIVAQDDTGFYPLDEVKIQTLLATRPSRQRDVNVVLTWCNELEEVGLVKVEDGGVTLTKGAEKNGIPRKDVGPFLYERVSHVNVTSTSREQHVAKSRVEKSREEKKRGEERGSAEGEAVSPPTPSRQGKIDPPHPDWWEPMTRLQGYKPGQHTSALDTIRAACESYEVDAAEVVAAFALYYPVGRVKHKWKDPVKALTKTIEIQIAKILQARDGHGINTPDSDEDKWAAAKRLTEALDAERER